MGTLHCSFELVHHSQTVVSELPSQNTRISAEAYLTYHYRCVQCLHLGMKDSLHIMLPADTIRHHALKTEAASKIATRSPFCAVQD